MGFIESYKHLEKLCGELLNDDRRISAYIDEMTNTPHGSRLVGGWDNDLKKLKYYRRVRNQISHEPDRTEENMCKPGDAEWLDDFYSRIMDQTDPLSLYEKAVKPRQVQKPIQTYRQGNYTYSKPATNKEPIGCFVFGICILVVVAAIALITGTI